MVETGGKSGIFVSPYLDEFPIIFQDFFTIAGTNVMQDN